MDALEERVEKAQPDIILKEIMGINRELGSLTEKINEVEKNLKKDISDLGKIVARTDYMLKFIIGLLLVALGVLIKSTFF